MEFDLNLLKSFAIALAIGALVGVEREKHRDTAGTTAGLRTFTLIALSGALTAWLGLIIGHQWLLIIGLIAFTLIVVARRYVGASEQETGLTTVVASLTVYLLGATTLLGYSETAVALGVTVSAILAFREPLHGLVKRIGTEDLFAGLKLLIATFIILPLIPNRTLDPWNAFNPFKVWLLAILISGLSLVGYVAMRMFGRRAGVAATGLSGGLVSSTAVTLSLAKRSQTDGASASHRLTTGILLAWTVMYFRLVVAVLVIFPPLVTLIAPVSAALATCCGAFSFYHWRRDMSEVAHDDVEIKNPFSLVGATQFALLFAAILFVVRLSEYYLPPSSIYGIAALAGLVDMDAITLSISAAAKDGALMNQSAVAILIASIANTITKAGMVVVLADKSMRKTILLPSIVLVMVTAISCAFLLA